MIALILATALSCSVSESLIQNIMETNETVVFKQELVEVIKGNTKEGCYEGSESNS